ncbi:Sulfoxide reductase heme-binding subunit YedZ [compost metagenome]
MSPLAKRWRQGQLIKLRRPLGLWCAAWAGLHFMVWLGLDLQFDWGLIGGELVKRSYIVVGMVALLLLIALSITSIPALLRRMGPSWQKLHNWIYAVALLVPVHYWWSVKSGWQEPFIYLLLACVLLVPRRDKLLRPWRRPPQPVGRAAQQPSRP